MIVNRESATKVTGSHSKTNVHRESLTNVLIESMTKVHGESFQAECSQRVIDKCS